MPLDSNEVDELKSAIAAARKRDLNFGLCLGKKPEGTVLVTHRIKGGEILGKQAKKAGETAKLAYGQMRVKGKNMMLLCADDAPSGAARKTKEFLGKVVGLKMKVQIMDANGNVLEEDGDESEETTVETPDTAPDPNEAKWLAAEPKVMALYEQVMKTNPENRSQLTAAWGMATEKAADGDYVGALKIAARLAEKLKEQLANAKTQDTSGQTDNNESNGELPGPKNTDLAKGRLLWTNALKKMRGDMDKLAATVMEQESKDPGNDPEDVEMVRQTISKFQEVLDPFDGRLEKTLTAAVDATSPEQKKNAIDESRKHLEVFEAHLTRHPVFPLIDNDNGYGVSLKIESTASASIKAIRGWLG